MKHTNTPNTKTHKKANMKHTNTPNTKTHKKANMKHTNTPNTKTQLFDIVINIAGVYPGDDGQKYASIHILRGDFEGTSIEDFVNHVNDFSKLCTPVVEV